MNPRGVAASPWRSPAAMRCTAALALIRSVLPAEKNIRLVGVTVSNFAAVAAETTDELPIFVEAAA